MKHRGKTSGLSSNFCKSLLITLFFFQIAGLLFALPPEIEADKHLLAAKRHMEDGNYSLAVEYFEKIIALNVTMPNGFYYHYGRARFQNKDYAGALECLELHIATIGRGDETYIGTLDLMGQCEENIAAAEAAQIAATQRKIENQISRIIGMIDRNVELHDNYDGDVYTYNFHKINDFEYDVSVLHKIVADRSWRTDDEGTIRLNFKLFGYNQEHQVVFIGEKLNDRSWGNDLTVKDGWWLDAKHNREHDYYYVRYWIERPYLIAFFNRKSEAESFIRAFRDLCILRGNVE